MGSMGWPICSLTCRLAMATLLDARGEVGAIWSPLSIGLREGMVTAVGLDDV